MSRDTLTALVRLTDTLYRAEQAKMRDLTQKEARYRHELARLDRHRDETRALTAPGAEPMRRIGADLLWQGWIARNREELNRQLALVLAQKARHLTALQRAHGKYQATMALLERQNAARETTRARREIETDQALSLLKTVSD